MKGLRKLVVAGLAFSCAILGARYFAFGESPTQAIRNMSRAVSGDTTSTDATESNDVDQAGVPAVVGAAPDLKPPDRPEVRVFFIGNSLTFYNEMPRMVERLAWSDGVNLHADQYAPGGATLRQHVEAAEVSQKLAAGRWDFVVIQEQSQLPAFAEAQVQAEMFPAAQELARMARAGSPQVQIVLYSTPAHKDGGRAFAQSVPEMATYEGMQSRSIKAYEGLAPSLNATIAQVGRIWWTTRAADPSANLYADDRHPNREGSYLIACVFYATLTGRTVVGNTFLAGLDADAARWLQEMSAR
jgi:hypothetical protein